MAPSFSRIYIYIQEYIYIYTSIIYYKFYYVDQVKLRRPVIEEVKLTFDSHLKKSN